MFNLAFHKDPNGLTALTEADIMQNRETFEFILDNYVDRSGIHDLLAWLGYATDFFIAPCSTIYHLCISGGLALHSLKVYEIFDQLCDLYYPTFPPESRAICSLLHDICKANTYKPCVKSRKTGEYWPNGKPKWEDYNSFEFEDDFPFGHGEKSVFQIARYMHLTNEEAMTIRWHMGAYDSAAKGDVRTLSKATEKYPVITLLHAADLIATSQGF